MSGKTSRPRGIYREHADRDGAASAYLSYGRHGFSVSADRYAHEGHSPAFNSLPWKEDYEAAQELGDAPDERERTSRAPTE